MVLWMNALQSISFVNPMQLSVLCEKTGALDIVEPGLKQAGH